MIKNSRRPVLPLEKVSFDKFSSLSFKKVQAYLLGFLWADGQISNRYTTNCEIIRQDFLDIEGLIKESGLWKVSFRDRSNRKLQASFRSSNKLLYEFLCHYDYDKKSVVSPFKIVNYIPKELEYMWWRGYFDGDGNLYVNTKNRTFQITFSSSYCQNWEYFENFLKNIIGCSKTSIQRVITKKGNKYSALRICGIGNCKDFLNFIYGKYDEVGLKRKYKQNLQMQKIEYIR